MHCVSERLSDQPSNGADEWRATRGRPPATVIYVPISASLPMFEHTAREIADDMERDPSPESQDIARRARELVGVFQSWGTQEPPAEARSEAIQKVLDLHREAQAHHASRR
jgi:hypothetical protein